MRRHRGRAWSRTERRVLTVPSFPGPARRLSRWSDCTSFTLMRQRAQEHSARQARVRCALLPLPAGEANTQACARRARCTLRSVRTLVTRVCSHECAHARALTRACCRSPNCARVHAPKHVRAPVGKSSRVGGVGSISEKPALRTRAGALPRPPGLLGLGQKTQFGG